VFAPIRPDHIVAPTQPEPQRQVFVSPMQPGKVRDFLPVRPVKSEPEVPPRQAEPTSIRRMEVPKKPEVPVQSEAKKPPMEEGSSEPEERTSEPHTKRKVRYEGEGGRIHTEAQIDELLDFYLMTGELPLYVSDRQRYDYRHHERLPERKELLEGRGIQVIIDLSGSARRAKNIIPLNGTKVQRQRSASH